jgi:hypothetical protein
MISLSELEALLCNNCQINLYYVVSYFFAFLLFLLPFLGLSFFANREWRKRNPHKRGFTWGYFVVFSSTALWSFGLFAAFDHEIRNLVDLLVFLLLSLLVLFVGLLGVLRVKWACWLLTLFSLNLPIWIVSFFYLRRRADELDKEALAGQSGFASLPKNLRVKIFWFVIWAIVGPVTFHLLDDGFAYESLRVSMVVLVPFPLFHLVIFVYRRYVI